MLRHVDRSAGCFEFMCPSDFSSQIYCIMCTYTQYIHCMFMNIHVHVHLPLYTFWIVYHVMHLRSDTARWIKLEPGLVMVINKRFNVTGAVW